MRPLWNLKNPEGSIMTEQEVRQESVKEDDAYIVWTGGTTDFFTRFEDAIFHLGYNHGRKSDVHGDEVTAIGGVYHQGKKVYAADPRLDKNITPRTKGG
jgi:hypothetical protein